MTPSMLIAELRANAQQPIDKADLFDMYEKYDALLDIAEAAIAYVEDAEHEDDCQYLRSNACSDPQAAGIKEQG